MSTKRAIEHILAATGVNDLLKAAWELSDSLGLQRKPCTRQLALARCDQYAGDDPDVKFWSELFKLGRNELSVAKICAKNVSDILALPINDEQVKCDLSKGLAIQCIEEVDHAVLSFQAVKTIPSRCGFSIYRKLVDANADVATRLLLVIILELREFDIRPRRIAKELSNTRPNKRILDADRLALMDDINHIRGGARLLETLTGYGIKPDLKKAKTILKELDKNRVEGEKNARLIGFNNPLKSRLNITPTVWTWITDTQAAET